VHDGVHDCLAQRLNRVFVDVLPADSLYGAGEPHVPRDGVRGIGYDPGDRAVQRAVVDEPRPAVRDDADVIGGNTTKVTFSCGKNSCGKNSCGKNSCG
jgi:hypothetical protein